MKKRRVLLTIISSLVVLWLFGMFLPNISITFAAQNQTVLTKLNVTNTDPRIYNITITPSPVTLTPGTSTLVLCNATIWDYNGVPRDISSVNATLYLSTTALGGALKNDTKYITSCQNVTTLTSMSALYTCNFSVMYFAQNGTWNCNISVFDTGNLNSSEANQTLIQPLIALNVSDLIDYGNVPVLNISEEKNANITNFGNIPINISVRGWGGQNESMYANLSMICEMGNISIEYERFNITPGSNYYTMNNLTDTNKLMNGLRVFPRNDTDLKINATYWRIKVPTGVGGLCNGTILFTASNA